MCRLLLFLPFLLPTIIFGQLRSDKYRAHPSHARSAARPLEDPRLQNYDVHFYHLDISADNLSTEITGKVRVQSSVVRGPIGEFVLEMASSLNLTRVEDVNSSLSLNFIRNGDWVITELPGQFAPGDIIDLRFYYHGTPPINAGFFNGVNNAWDTEWNRQVTWTLSEPFNAKDWWPVKQDLTDKADSAFIYITVPEKLKAGAPGKLIKTVELPDNRVRYEWESRNPIAYYLISMAIAEYQEYTLELSLPGQEAFQMVNYIYNHPEYLSRYRDDINQIADMMEIFSTLFGPYPYADEKYGHAAAPMGGGMEHQTMSTMDGFDFNLAAHELAHQWFGNLVTCGTWNDIWINEGFARYGEYLAIENLVGKEQADYWMRLLQDYVKRAPGGSLYIQEDPVTDPYRIFDFRLTYNKGGSILHTLRYLINDDELFFGGLRSFLDKFRNSTATGADFENSMESHTGRDLENFFREWYYGEGYPIYDIAWDHRNDSLSLDIEQTTSAPASVQLFTTPLPVKVTVGGRDTLFRLAPSASTENFRIFLPGSVTALEIDPDNYLIKTVNSIRRMNVTSIADISASGIRIFPNPASAYLNLQFSDPHEYEIILSDLIGRILIEKKGHNSMQRISTQGIPPGIYLLLIETDGRKFQTKIAIR